MIERCDGVRRRDNPVGTLDIQILDRPAVALKVTRLPGELEIYVCGQSDIIIDDATARRREEPILTAVTESTVQWLLHRRMNAQKQMRWTPRGAHLVETASLSGAILLIVGTATAMAWALTQAGFANSLASLMISMPGGHWGFLAISIVVFIILGSVLEGLPAMVLFGPLLFPVARNLGINDVHYAIVAILAMGIGLFSPPFGVGFYQSCLIGRASSDQALGPIWAYMAALIAALAIVAAVPWLTTGFLT